MVRLAAVSEQYLMSLKVFFAMISINSVIRYNK